MKRMRCMVSGRVQGVFFRGSAREEARRLGLNGFARNLPDGRVEVIAAGPEAAVETFRQWLHQGPPAARVDSVECEPWDGEVPADFSTG